MPLSYLLQDVSWVFLAVAVVLAALAAARFSRPLAAKCAGDRYVAAALILYCGVLVAVTCVPRRDTPAGMGLSTFSEGLRFSLHPDALTMELTSPLSSLEEMANLALFAPFGFLLLWLTRKPVQAVLVSASFSVVIEIWQGFVGRSLDVGDVLHNALGAAVGVGIGWLAGTPPGTRL